MTLIFFIDIFYWEKQVDVNCERSLTYPFYNLFLQIKIYFFEKIDSLIVACKYIRLQLHATIYRCNFMRGNTVVPVPHDWHCTLADFLTDNVNGKQCFPNVIRGIPYHHKYFVCINNLAIMVICQCFQVKISLKLSQK